MTLLKTLTAAGSDEGIRAALLFALVAERLATFYEHGRWPTDAQAASLAGSWLVRAKRSLPPAQVRTLAASSGDMARRIEGSLSREAGLYTAHEMMESLDPRQQSATGQALMEECVRLVRSLDDA